MGRLWGPRWLATGLLAFEPLIHMHCSHAQIARMAHPSPAPWSWPPSLLHPELTLHAQLREVCVLLPCIRAFLALFKPAVLRWCLRQPWMPCATRNGRLRLKGVGIPDSDLCSAALMHGVGALLCAPAFFRGRGLASASATALARHGALFEAAYELEDCAERFYTRFCKRNGKALQPPLLLAVACAHHVLAIGMVVPMNVCFPELPEYSELLFWLLGTAVTFMVLAQYGQVLCCSLQPSPVPPLEA